MTDMEVGISNAAKNVFPNSTWHYCWFHVSQNVVSKLDELKFPLPKLKHLIFNEIKKIHQSTTVANAKKKILKFTKLLSTIQLEDFQLKCSQFIEYCATYYWCNDDTLQRWILHRDQNGHIMDATNNSIE